jgi:wyosine [tRNA(Phe)-imidazoG37] synthetase (radical SAM superfamily)
MKEDGQAPDAITFAGNGEPTIHPHFPGVIEDTIHLRDTYFPEAKITVLSNASMLHRKNIFNALKSVDNNIQKLDTGSEALFQLINQPAGKLNLEKLVEQLCHFKGNLIVQTLFLRGKHKGGFIDNTTKQEVEAWIKLLEKIRPEYVMIYPIDRATPDEGIEKISFDELSAIAVQVNNAGIKTKVFG